MVEKQTFSIGKDSWIMNKMKIQIRKIPIKIKEKSRMTISISILTSLNKISKKKNSMVEARKRVRLMLLDQRLLESIMKIRKKI